MRSTLAAVLETSSAIELPEGLAATPVLVAQVEAIARMVSATQHLPLIGQLLQEFYAISQVALIPEPFILPTFAAFESTCAVLRVSAEESTGLSAGVRQLMAAMLKASVKPLETRADLDVAAFTSLYTVPCLRLEALGLIYAVAGRSCIYSAPFSNKERADFVRVMYYTSTYCLRLCREIAPTNDILTWLACENMYFTQAVHGDSHSLVLRRSTDLVNDLFNLGIHREAVVSANVPFWLAELRRKVFAVAYNWDKFIAACSDRPPLLTQRHADVTMPLDLSAEELLADQSVRDRAISQLTPDGWSKEARFNRVTWARLRRITNAFREEFLEYLVRPLSDGYKEGLR